MAPGGLEALVLKLANPVAAWLHLKEAAGRLEALGKPDGICPSLVARLVSAVRRLRPHTGVTHHNGPLIHAGTAARIAGAPDLICVEHDGWHFGSRQRRWLGCASTINALNPHLVAISPALGPAQVSNYKGYHSSIEGAGH
jgi:hypothetical protein